MGGTNQPSDLSVVMKLSLDTSNGLGSYQSVSDLDAVDAQVQSVRDEVVALLQNNELDIDDDAVIVVTSAQSQVVSGTNYKVTLNVGAFKSVLISYYVDLPVNDAKQIPTNLHLIDAGESELSVGSYSDISDLSEIEPTVSSMDSDIRSLLISDGLSVEDDDMISVVSASKQVVAGTNYQITFNVGLYDDVIIQYFVDLPSNDAEQTPSNLQLIDLGSTINLIFSTIDSFETTVSLKSEESVKSTISLTVQWVIIASVLAFVVLIAVVSISLCLRRNNAKTSGNGLYAQLNYDTIDETL